MKIKNPVRNFLAVIGLLSVLSLATGAVVNGVAKHGVPTGSERFAKTIERQSKASSEPEGRIKLW